MADKNAKKMALLAYHALEEKKAELIRRLRHECVAYGCR